jgi:hypothetical protein
MLYTTGSMSAPEGLTYFFLYYILQDTHNARNISIY